MSISTFVLIYGIVFLVVGIAGFIPGLVTEPVPAGLAVEAAGGYLFGLFPVNVLHNFVHLLFGIWGLAASRAAASARLYAQAVAITYTAFVLMGLIPALRTVFGLVPLFGHDVWLHALLAGVAAYFGFADRYAPGDTATLGTQGPFDAP